MFNKISGNLNLFFFKEIGGAHICNELHESQRSIDDLAHRNGSKYSETKAYQAVKEAITCNQCVLVIGEAGCGKSITVKYVAENFIQHQNDYILETVTSFGEIDPNISQKTLYIFYDVFGIFNCDNSFIDVLDHYRDIELLLKRKHSKLIMTSRRSVYKKLEKFNFSVVASVIDLNSELLSLSDHEKKNIYEKICCPAFAEHLTTAVKCKHASFPLLCELFFDFPELQESPSRFFENPVDAFLLLLNTLKKCRLLTYRLLVCVALHDKIDCPLDSKENSHRKLKLALQAFQPECNIKMTEEELVEEFKEFVKETKWLKKLKESNFYTFQHKFVHEIVAYHYGKNHIDDLLTEMGSNFVAEKIRLDDGSERNADELFLYVNASKLANRLFHDIHYHINYFQVFTNNCCKNISFCDAFQSELQGKDKSVIDDLFWKCQNIKRSTRLLSNKTDKKYISLKNDDSEWFRHKLLEVRTETISKNRIEYELKIKAVSWVFGYGIHRIFPGLLTDQMNAKKMTHRWEIDSSEMIRFLMLAIFSKNIKCFERALDLANLKNLSKICISNNMECDLRHKHNNFTPLTAACYTGFSKAIAELVNKGSDVNHMDKNGSTPLVLACRFASFSDTTFLIDKGAKLCCTSGNGVSPLIAAVMGKNVELVAFLLKRTVDVNQCSSKRKSPLYYAAKLGSLDIVKILIGEKASINEPDIEGRTPLYWASQNGFHDIAEYLISKQASVDQCDTKEKTPLYCASKRRYFSIAELMLNKGADVNKATHHNKTPLFRAAKRGYFEMCKMLIEKGANVNKTDREGSAPLYWAAKRGHIDIVNLLLEKEASTNNKNDKGKTALHCVAQSGRVDIANSLIKKGADVHTEDLRKRSPLYCASKRGHVSMVKFLIECGSDCNKRTIKSKSAVLCASKRSHNHVLQALLRKGAGVNLADDNGVSPLHFAAQRGHLEIVQILLDAGADVNCSCKKKETALFRASQSGEYSIVKNLLDYEANVDQTDESGNTALICAAKGGYLKIVKLLVEKRADVNIKNTDHQTPLIFASKGNHLEVVEYLIKQKADVNVQDRYSQTALLWATEKGYFDLVKMLCENRCNVNDSNDTGQTPIFLAAKFGHIEIVKYLLERGADKRIIDKYQNCPRVIAHKMGYMDIYDILI